MTGKRVLAFQITLLVLSVGVYGADVSYTYCAYRDDTNSIEKESDSDSSHLIVQPRGDHVSDGLDKKSASPGVIMADNKTILCAENKDFCYTYWRVDPTGKTETVALKQGCWDHPNQEECVEQNCVDRRAPNNGPRMNNTHFCCCRGDMCNKNFTDDYVPGSDVGGPLYSTPVYEIYDPNYKEKAVIIALASVFAVAMVILLGYLGIRLFLGSQKPQTADSVHLVESPPTPSYDLDNLKMTSLVVRGRFGEVWKGTLNDISVAVKVFHLGQKQYYQNEKNIYSLPHIEHSSIPRFYGSEERLTVDGVTQYVLVMAFAHYGALTSYLKNNSIDWKILCKMCQSMASGLAHLHTEFNKCDAVKPAIAHRDFNSRNVLVKHDLSCCICDFGFAIQIAGSRFIRNGHEEDAALADVGTLRYMAPEVLEGAVNLRDCEASLKQIDVYALGLVFWEIASRCSDLYQGLPVPEYQLPFQSEVGAHPTFEDLQQLVSRNKARPLFPEIWKDTNQAIRALKETIEDCWDQDAEARLTAQCVQERVLDMDTLWENRHKGITPTIHGVGCLGDLKEKANIQCNATSSLSSNQTAGQVGLSSTSDQTDANGNTSTAAPVLEKNETVAEMPGPRISSRMSTSTVETTLSSTESSDPPTAPKVNWNLVYGRTNRKLQPHQGQNPTVERNTHKHSDEELAVVGNTLVDKSLAEAAKATGTNGKPYGMTPSYDELLDAIADNLESSLVQNDMLNQQQRTALLPFAQNRVNTATQPLVVRPKQPNVPGNGTALANKNNNPNDNKSKFRFGKFRLPKVEKGGSKLSRTLFGRGSNKRNSAGPIVCNGTSATSSQVQSVGDSDQHLPAENGLDQAKSNLQPRPISTEVYMVNGTPIVRPSSLPLGGATNQPSRSEAETADSPTAPPALSENRLGMAEVGVAKLQPAACAAKKPSLVFLDRRAHSSVDLSPSGVGLTNGHQGASMDNNPGRPSSLLLNGHAFGGSDSLFNRNAAPKSSGLAVEPLKKTTVDTGKAVSNTDPDTDRFKPVSSSSLNDDDNHYPESSISLQQFASGGENNNLRNQADYQC